MTEKPQRFDYNRTMSPESEAVAIEVWKSLFPRIDQAAAKTAGEYVVVVDEKSSLRYDDRYLGWWRSGGLHVTGMSASMDALLAVKAILERAIDGTGELPMAALYPMIRASIESASLAVYLLAPDLRDERLRRSYLVASVDARYHGTFAEDVGRTGNTLLADARAHILELIASRPSLGKPADFVFAEVSYTDLVKDAEAVIAADPAVLYRKSIPLIAWWKLLSGFSHGKAWSFHEVADRSEAIVDTENETALLKMTAPAAVVALSLERAVETLETALRLYGRRSKEAWNQPEDALEPAPVKYAELRAEGGPV